VWKKFGPLSCLLNVDEVDDLQSTWNYIGQQIGMEGDAVKKAVEPVKDMYTILDHTRCVLMAIEDVSTRHDAMRACRISLLHPCSAFPTD
jgi:alanyl-tRNA synthetase